MKQIFLDTSVIIDHLNDILTPQVGYLREMFGIREMVIGDLVLMEVLQGIREPRQIWLTEEALAAYACFELGGVRRARDAASVYRHLRSAGVTPRSSIDVMIATFCVQEDLDLLASDRDFRLMVPHIGLALAGPPFS